jgi:hypothetical protein
MMNPDVISESADITKEEMSPMPQDIANPSRREFFQKATATLATAAVIGGVATTAEAQTSNESTANTMMMTIFLRHDETKTLGEINAHLDKTGFRKNFPPQWTEVVSWYVMMGIGQVVTLRFPPSRLREVNLQIENGAWGGYRTEFYPTYDYKSVWEASRKEVSK